MDRNEFLNLAMTVSKIPNVVMEIKNVPENLQVVSDGIYYYPFGYEMKFKNGQVLHYAVLHQLKTSGFVYTPLDNVKRFKEKGD